MRVKARAVIWIDGLLMVAQHSRRGRRELTLPGGRVNARHHPRQPGARHVSGAPPPHIHLERASDDSADGRAPSTTASTRIPIFERYLYRLVVWTIRRAAELPRPIQSGDVNLLPALRLHHGAHRLRRLPLTHTAPTVTAHSVPPSSRPPTCQRCNRLRALSCTERSGSVVMYSSNASGSLATAGAA